MRIKESMSMSMSMSNTFLYKIALVESPLCTFCKEFPETILHLFSECGVVNSLIREVVSWLNGIMNETITLTAKEIILGISSNKFNTLNLLIVLLKYYVYKNRAKNLLPTFEGYIGDVQACYKCEQYISRKNMTEDIFKKKWRMFIEYLSNNISCNECFD